MLHLMVSDTLLCIFIFITSAVVTHLTVIDTSKFLRKENHSCPAFELFQKRENMGLRKRSARVLLDLCVMRTPEPEER